MATRKAKQDPVVAAAIEAARSSTAQRERERRALEEKLATERASALAKPRITEVRPDGSRWTFTPAPGADLVAVADVERKLAAIKPHKNPTARKPETIEAYARRMARVHALPEIGVTVDTTPKCFRRYGETTDAYVRLPDDADEGAPREASDLALADACAVETAIAATTIEASPEIAHERTERAVAAVVRAESRDHTAELDRLDGEALRPFRGAGAWSRRDQRVRIPVITLSEVA